MSSPPSQKLPGPDGLIPQGAKEPLRSTEGPGPSRPPAPLPRRRAELLLPAGDLAKLQTAIRYGADAVYAGTPDLSLRTRSGFTLEGLSEGIAFAHARGKKIYLTLNLFAHNRDIERLPEFLTTIRKLGPDGVIISDLGIFNYVRREAPELELHVSTQANVTSWWGVNAWRELGASVVVLARELSFDELREIRERCPDIRLETFVHGAMCMTYSGRCLLSNYMAERGANQGSCAHSCRWKYNLKVVAPDGSVGQVEVNDKNMSDFSFFLEEEFRPGELYPIEEDQHGAYILNSRDLNLMPKLGEYLALGIDSLKVEGRSKSIYYTAVVARAYRAAIDAYYNAPDDFDPAPFLQELSTVPSRGYTLGFHSGRLEKSGHDYESGVSLSAFEFAGVIREVDSEGLTLEVKNRLEAGDVLEFLPEGELAVVRLRKYEFSCSLTGRSNEKVTAGEGRAIRIGWEEFHTEDPDRIRQSLTPGVVARKAKPLTTEEEVALKRQLAASHNEEPILPADRLTAHLPEAPRKAMRTTKPPRLGALGCCGLGCNGCLPFFTEPKYEMARRRLEARGAGRSLMKGHAPAMAPAQRSFAEEPSSNSEPKTTAAGGAQAPWPDGQ